MEERANKRKVLTGTVSSDKMIKTRVVVVTSPDRHAKYQKRLIRQEKYKAHDEKNESHTGDLVTIQETRPLSKDKRWIIIRIEKKNETKAVAA
jgi:small subunit ribosomal protein S17